MDNQVLLLLVSSVILLGVVLNGTIREAQVVKARKNHKKLPR